MSLSLICGSPRTGTTFLMNWLKAAFTERKVWVRESGVPCLIHHLVCAMEFERRDHRWGFDLVQDQALRTALLEPIRAMGFRLYQKYGWESGLPIFDKEPYFGPDGPLFFSHLREVFPEIQLIYLVRSPRAVLSSMLRRKWARGPFPRMNRIAPFDYMASATENSICDEIPGGESSLVLTESSGASLKKCCANYRNAIHSGVALLEQERVLFLNYEDLSETERVREVVSSFLGATLALTPVFEPPAVPMRFSEEEEAVIQEELGVLSSTFEAYEVLCSRAASDFK